VPVYLRTLYQEDDFFKTRHACLPFTTWPTRALSVIHPGVERAGLEPIYTGHPGVLWGCEFSQGGIVYADLITTVSETYSREIQTPEFGHGLDGCCRRGPMICTGAERD